MRQIIGVVLILSLTGMSVGICQDTRLGDNVYRYDRDIDGCAVLTDTREAVVCMAIQEHPIASGVIVRADGFVLTNYHVANEDNWLQLTVITYSGQTYGVEWIYPLPRADLCLVKIDAAELPSIKWGNTDDLYLGQKVYAMGHPLLFYWTISRGVISAAHVKLSTGVRYIQIDANIQQGSSGGPVFNDKGEVVGIVSWVMAGHNMYGPPISMGLNFAIDGNVAHAFSRAVMSVYDNLRLNE
jgi:serine protease Do